MESVSVCQTVEHVANHTHGFTGSIPREYMNQ